MRKKLSLIAILVLVATGSARAYDFSAVTSSGHTLYYNIVSGGVEVTHPGSTYYPWSSYSQPTGALAIDSAVTYGSNTYPVTTISSMSFYGCTGLASVTIPNSVTNIGDRAFFDCTGLTSVTIPNSVTNIGVYAFYNCTGLTSVSFNATNCTSVGSSSSPVFGSCPNITSVTIGNNVQRIPNCLFSGCTGLTSVIIGNSVTSIGGSAFYRCTGLTSVSIPNSVTNIGESAFYGCTGLTSVSYNASNCTWAGSINNPVFGSCPNITSVTIGNSVQTVPSYLFYGCTGLTSVTISNSVTSIGSSAFYGCTSLTSASLGNGVTSIGNNAFNGCTSLISINIPDATTTIGSSAFNGCTSLTSASIGDGVTSIGDDAFLGCLRLTSVRLGEGVINIGSQTFKDCGIIGELVIPQSVTTIGREGFRNCYGINEITCLGRVAPTLDYDVFLGLDTSITVNIPCGTTNLYAGRWSYFHHFNEIPFLFNVASDNLAYGTVQMLQEPSCDDPVAIVKATARTGYHFDHWSDGSTQNPYTCVVTGSMTLTAFFASDHGQTGIEDADGEADGPNVYADGGRIVVTGAEGEDVSMYDMMGRRIATRQEYNGPVVIEVPAAGIYLVRVGEYPARRVVVVR